MITTLALTVAFLAPPVPSKQVSKHKDPDTIKLTDGKELVGRVIYDDDERVLMRVRRKEREIPHANIQSIRTLERSLAEWAERYDGIAAGDVDALVELARFCEERGLASEARITWAKALLADPSREESYEALEARKATKGWQFKIGRKWRTLDEVKQIHGKWKERWEIETTHFVLRTDRPIDRVLDVAMDIERYYLAFYDALRPELAIQVFDELPVVNLYVEAGKMPTPPVPTDAWFDRGRNELDLAVVHGLDEQRVMSEMAKLLIYNALRKTIGQTGNLTPWAAEGIGSVMGSAVTGEPGHLRFDRGVEVGPFFEAHASASKPVELSRLLRMAYMEFYGGPDADLARAQAYTLVHFLVYGEEGKYRTGFLAFLRSAYQGQGSETHFKRELGIKDLSALEAAWLEYAKAKG